jgi:hypothetical protein
MKTNSKYIILSIFILLSACEKTAEWYMGFDKQPEFFDGNEYTKAINVFGVLRPSLFDDEQESFVRVEKTASAKVIEYPDSLAIKDAGVIISYSDSTGLKSLMCNFEKVESQNISGLYKHNDLKVEAGRIYNLQCSSFGYDTVYAETRVPNQPEILSFNKEGNVVTLEIESDASAFFYEAVCNSVSSGYVTPAVNKTILVLELNPDEQLNNEVMVFAYDENLASYFSDVTSSLLNLNSFRAPYTTVDGGYGCFGSLNYTSVTIE